jgi:hypothetical protein
VSVYFAQAGAYIKIGYSKDPFDRMTTVTRHGRRPADLPRAADADLLGWVPGGRSREAELHRRFADCHVDGEWYYLEPGMVRSLIWSDPAGVDIQRMSALAVLAAHRYEGATRDQIAAWGIPVEAVSEEEAIASLGRAMGAARAAAVNALPSTYCESA